jgi:hypothetical protein
VQLLNILLGVETARNARLICNQKHKVARIVETPNCGSGTGHPTPSFATADISVIEIQHAIPIEEDRGTNSIAPQLTPTFAILD